jgi:phenylalanyl-tRNA synthetase beta chain
LFSEIEKIAFKVGKPLLKSVNLFDIYEGENIETGKKSYAVSFILQNSEKTLSEKEIDTFMEKLMKAFSAEINAKIR